MAGTHINMAGTHIVLTLTWWVLTLTWRVGTHINMAGTHINMAGTHINMAGTHIVLTLTWRGTHIDMEGPDSVVSIDGLSREDNPEGSIISSVGLWPVLCAFFLPGLCQIGEHDDGGCPQLPYQPPEVHHRILHWT